MDIKEALEVLRKDRDLCNFNPLTGECIPMNEDCRQSVEAYDTILEHLKWITDKGEAKWILHTSPFIRAIYCSKCGFEKPHKSVYYNFCPNCGRKMKGENDECNSK